MGGLCVFTKRVVSAGLLWVDLTTGLITPISFIPPMPDLRTCQRKHYGYSQCPGIPQKYFTELDPHI